MAISKAVLTTYFCQRCGEKADLTEWVAIDAVERPDLAAVLAEGEWLIASCSRCGGEIPRATHLLATRLDELAPVLLGRSYDALETSTEADPVGDSRRLLDETRKRMVEAASDAPGPVLVVPLDVLGIAAGRDLESDIVEPTRVLEELEAFSPFIASNYGTFLDAVRDSLPERRLTYALDHLVGVSSFEALRDLFARYPELRSDEALSRVSGWAVRATEDEERHVAQSHVELLRRASSGDFQGAWEGYERALVEMLERFLVPRTEALFDELEARIESRQWEEAIVIGEELLGLAGTVGGEHIEARAAQRLAVPLYELHGPGRLDRLERMIELLTRALAIYDERPELADDSVRALAVQNLGTVYAARFVGDPLANLERAISMQRRALELISREGDPHSWAMAEANLGHSLFELSRQRERIAVDEEGEPVEDAQAAKEVEEAISHLERSLEWRSMDRDPRDFAYSKANLALAWSHRIHGDARQNLEAALSHYEEAAAGFARVDERIHLGLVHHNTSNNRLRLARMEESEGRRQALLEAAIHDARKALELRTLEEAPYDAGRSWQQLGDCLVEAGDRSSAVHAYQMAVRGLPPELAPAPARDAARALAGLASQQGDWLLAADAWNHAAEAASQALDVRATSAGRSVARRRSVNVFRFAAYANARAGNVERAVELLELGRARELGRWMSREILDLDRLRELDPVLAERFTTLQARLEMFDQLREPAREGGAAEVAEIAEALDRVVAEIRELPGLKTFLLRPRYEEIRRALPAGKALAYLLTSPDGSLALLLTGGDDEIPIEAIDAPNLRSTQLIPLFLGFDLEGNVRDTHGYFVAHRDYPEEIDDALAAFEPLLGKELLRPLDHALERHQIESLCLIPISLLGLLPLHAIFWDEGDARHCLLERLPVSFAPSAFARRVCEQRAGSLESARRALIIGNPLPQTVPLDGAELEAELVAASLAEVHTELLVGTDATKERVIAALPGVDLVHFACHASASILGDRPGQAALSLAGDEPLRADEIRGLASFRPRLVVASACETGVVEGYDEADEALSLGVMFIAAGAASVVSTLWAIDDWSTMLLMSHLYELLRAGDRPDAALREAQLWLRGLEPDEENAYLLTRPLLRARKAERRRTRRDPRDGRGETDEQPYADLSVWAAFVVTGA